MGLRFRKSIKIAPGVKLNLNKKSIGLSAGVKGAHVTINSKGRKTTSVGIPGTGISYTQSSGGGSTGGSQSSAATQSTSGGKSNGGCLMLCLKIIGILLLFSLVVNFGWIAGAVWFLFFRKKMDDDKKKLGYSITIGILSVFSFFMFLYSVATSGNNANTTTPVQTTTEYQSEITSEIETDSEPESESDPESESESELESSTELETVTESENIPTESVTEEPESPEPTTVQEETTQSISVWIAGGNSSSQVYHSRSYCSGMDDPVEITLDQATNMGRRPCKRCH